MGSGAQNRATQSAYDQYQVNQKLYQSIMDQFAQPNEGWNIPDETALWNTSEQAMQAAIAGMDPSKSAAYYQAKYLPAAEEMMKKTTLPGIMEGYVRSGAATGGAMGQGIQTAWQDFGNQQNVNMANYMQGQQQLGTQVAAQLPSYLNAKQNFYQSANPASNPLYQLALNYMNPAYSQQPAAKPKNNDFGDILSGVGSIAGAIFPGGATIPLTIAQQLAKSRQENPYVYQQ